MKPFIPQTHNACLAYALYFIGALPMEEVKEYEAAVVPALYTGTLEQLEWVADTVPFALPAYEEYMHKVKGIVITADAVTIPKKGKGVAMLVVTGDNPGGHAVAYENGLILDPAGPGIMETWEEMETRYLSAFRFIELESIAPYKRGRNERKKG